MGFKFYIYFAIVLCITVIIGLCVSWQPVTLGIIAAACSVCILLGMASVNKQIRAARNGISLLKSQDFASRLRPTGDRSADEIVELFNRLMDALKAERLKTLEQSHFLGKLVEVSPMGIAICDFDGVIIQKNTAFCKFESPHMLKALLSIPLGETRSFRIDSAQIFRCSHLWFMDSGFRRPFYLVELLTREIALAEKNVFKKIVRTIGHEVNNTMGSVKSILETVAALNAADPLMTEATFSAISSCDNLSAFVRGYAEVVKLPEPTFVPTDTGNLVTGLEAVLRATISPHISLDVRIINPATVKLDPMLIERVLVNIVKNASESIADKPDGLISVTVRDNTLTINDNGHGLSAESAQRIFTPFYSTKHADRGLGLMLVSDILRAHNARFSLATNPVDLTTTFTITFDVTRP